MRGATEEDERLDVFVSNVLGEPPPWDVWSGFAKGFLAEATPAAASSQGLGASQR